MAAFPPDCVGAICDVFLRRSAKLLSSPESAILKIHYSVLTLKLLVEKDEHALHHIALGVAKQEEIFLKAAFEFMLSDLTQDAALQVKEMLSYCISAIYKHISVQTGILFENEIAVRGTLNSLQALLSEDILKKIPIHIIHLMLNTLFEFSSRWASQPEKIQHRALAILQKMLQDITLQTCTIILTKAILIQILSSTALPMDEKVHISVEEAAFLLGTSCSKSLGFTTLQMMFLLKYLALCATNKEILLHQGVLEFLAPLVNEDSTQEPAAELLCSIMSPDPTASTTEEGLLKSEELDIPEKFECKFESLSIQDIDSHEMDDVSDHDNGAVDVVTGLLSCAIECFKNFTAACGEHSQSVASLNLMYTSTLIRMILDMLSQENDSIQTTIANSMAALPGAPEAFVHMLWGSSVVLPLDTSQFPSPSWLSTFFDIHNCLVLCTHASEVFSVSLCDAGFAHFVESELIRLRKVLLHIDKETNKILKAQLLSVLTILYNCIQKKQCLPIFLGTHHLSNQLMPITLSPNFEIRFLSKFILGFLSLILTVEECNALKFQPDEIYFIITSLSNISRSFETLDCGYSTEELLQGLLNLSEVKENGQNICFNPAIMKCLDSLLSNKYQAHHSLILQIIWNIVLISDEHITVKNIIPTIKTMSVTSGIEILHYCVMFVLYRTEGKNPLNLLEYARGCFQYQKYEECIASADQIIHLNDESTVKEAKLLKGKSFFFSYQNLQQVFLRRRGSERIKQIELLKKECYEKARKAILLLGVAQDFDFLDDEGSKLLDCAMIDYLRETNNLNSCQRCLLCRKKAKLRRSHIFPKSVLKAIASDLRVGDDHKVFSSMIGKVIKKSAGEATFGMLCSDCEQCLSQNGEDQFFKHVHSKIYANREMIESHLTLPYGGWLFDFCVGIFFRSFAVSHQLEVFGRRGEKLYKIFSDCRQHLLALPTNTPQKLKEKKENEGASGVTTPENRFSSPLLSPSQPLLFSFFVNPTLHVSSSDLKLQYILKGPAFFMSPIDLNEGIYCHDKQPSLILAHFDHINILIQLQTGPSVALQNATINPDEGELIIPNEHERWQSIPTGVWRLFSAFAQASENMNQAKTSSLQGCTESEECARPADRSNFVYAPKNTVSLKHSTIFSLLPGCYSHKLMEDTSEVAIKLPENHRILIRIVKKWGHEQQMMYIVAEDSDVLYLVYVLSVPGWHILDGLLLDTLNCSVSLPFLNGKKEEQHALKLPVIQAFIQQVPEIIEYLHVRAQLS